MLFPLTLDMHVLLQETANDQKGLSFTFLNPKTQQSKWVLALHQRCHISAVMNPSLTLEERTRVAAEFDKNFELVLQPFGDSLFSRVVTS